MVLIIADNIGTRLDMHRSLRKNGIISQAPPPTEVVDAVLSGKFEVVVFCEDIWQYIIDILPPGTICVGAGIAAEHNDPGIIYFQKLFSRELLSFLAEAEGVPTPMRHGELYRAGRIIYQAGYPLKLRATERIILSYLMEHDAADAVELESISSSGWHRERASEYISAMVSRINRNALAVGGRKIIGFDGDKYRIRVPEY